ncbi:hypothetical protein [Moorena bouillonii]|uniref:hypothetical protein n=1 Tax=Moorena bouillonii TaxID=207920 RepID=UPI0013016DEF|nr:hypothetical protein [Moorena bouillonii]
MLTVANLKKAFGMLRTLNTAGDSDLSSIFVFIQQYGLMLGKLAQSANVNESINLSSFQAILY